MKTIQFAIPIKPHPKQRHRTFRNKYTGRNVNVDTPENIEYESVIRDHFWRATADMDNPLCTNAIVLSCQFYFAMPQSYTKKKRQQIASADYVHTVKPDLDNLIKAVKDALNGVAWSDDCKVYRYDNCYKEYSQNDQPLVVITICDIDCIKHSNPNRLQLTL